MRRTALALTATAALVAAGLVGVATAARQSAAKPPVKRAVSATGTTLAFNKKALTAPAGRVKLILNNKSDIRHDISIRGNGLAAKNGKIVGPGGVSTVTVTVRPGRYTYFCKVGGHESAGMKGTLAVPQPARR